MISFKSIFSARILSAISLNLTASKTDNRLGIKIVEEQLIN
jgi:hypothetical protein